MKPLENSALIHNRISATQPSSRSQPGISPGGQLLKRIYLASESNSLDIDALYTEFSKLDKNEQWIVIDSIKSRGVITSLGFVDNKLKRLAEKLSVHQQGNNAARTGLNSSAREYSLPRNNYRQLEPNSGTPFHKQAPSNSARPGQILRKSITSYQLSGNNNYNNLITVFRQLVTDYPNDAHVLFNQLIDAGIQPDRIIYNAMIQAYVKNSQTKVALNTLYTMINAGMQPSAAAYNALISLFVDCNELEEAYKLLQSGVVNLVYDKRLGYSSHERKLNLHVNSIYSLKREYEHEHGVPPSVAQGICYYHLFKKKSYLSGIIVGQHGKDKIKVAIIEILDKKGIAYTISPQNPGYLELVPQVRQPYSEKAPSSL